MTTYWRNLEVLSSVESTLLDAVTSEKEQAEIVAAFDLIRNTYDTVSGPEE